jgi:type IV pilus assembly protein PilY1
VDFAASGERQVSDFEQRGNILLASSLIPATSGGANSCSPAGGSSNEYALNVDNGNGTFVASNVGIMGKMIVIDTGTSSEETDSTGKRIRTVTSQVIQQGSTGQSVTSTIAITSFAGRLSWRQINNYRRQP